MQLDSLDPFVNHRPAYMLRLCLVRTYYMGKCYPEKLALLVKEFLPC